MAARFGAYEVLEQVAEGSTGVVYRARHTELDRVAAIKELSPAMRGVPGQLERMRAEAGLLAELDNPHIVAVYDYVEEPERVWLAEQWVSGASLRDILRVHGRLSPEQSVGAVRGALIGLAYAHERGLLHRDFSPSNVLADLEGTSMLVDFGLAAPVGDSRALGTPAYISPEAVRGEPATPSSDVYSVAAVLYELLSGEPPFGATDVPTALRLHVEQPAPALEGHGADLQELVRKGLAKDPGERPRDAAAFLAELEAAAQRRFGAGWLGRASIAGIVGAVAAGGVVGAAGAGAGVAGAAQTVVVESSAIGTGASALATQTVKKSRLPLMAGAAGVVVVVAVATTAVAMNGGDDSNDADASTTPTSSPTSTTTSSEPPPPPTVEERAPTGVYALLQTLKSSDFPDDKVGSKVRRTWTFAPEDCGTNRCSGEITSSSGLVLTYTWNGSSLVLSKLDPDVREGLCIDTDTGEKIPGSHFKATRTYVNSPLRAVGPSDQPGGPSKFVGVQTIKEVTTELSDGCRDRDGVNHAKLSMVLTIKRG